MLTRLATEPDALAQVAAQALELMHHRKPAGAWSVAALPELEIKRDDGSSVCEAGCYQCLLSYFNQPDHEHINRRDPMALGLLVAMANARAVPQAMGTSAGSAAKPAAATDAGERHAQWLTALLAAGGRKPDDGPLAVLEGRAQMAAKFAATRTLVTLQSLPYEIVTALGDKGWTVIDMSDPSQWPQQFAAHAALFN